MSLVPDLNGSEFNPSFVAYYNVIENTDLETIDDIRNLNNVLSGTIIESYTDDQGIVIEYKSVPTRDKVIVRASKSGIITVHITKASETDNENDDMLDIINWKDNNNSYDLNNTILEDVLKECLKGLNDWESKVKPKYKSKDVKLDNLKYDTEDIQFSIFSFDWGYNNENTNPQEYEFSYTDETQIVDMSFAHSINVTKYSSITTEVYVDSERVFSQGAGNSSSSGGGGSRVKYNLFQDYNAGNVCKVEIPATGYFGGNVSVHIMAVFR